jgi:hypothetical protein
MISDLEGDDSFIISWRIIQLVGKITVTPSDSDLELRKVTGIIQTRGNLFIDEVRKFLDNVLKCAAGCQISKDKANGNSCPFNPRFTPKDIRCAYNMILPVYLHINPLG